MPNPARTARSRGRSYAAGTLSAAVPPARHFSWLPLITVTTSFGGVDCLLERGRFDWERLRQGAETIAVADAGVLVAGRADAWALRRQFRQ
jgi:hypothetical protein